MPGNDEEPGADGEGVFDESNDKVGNLERLHQAGPPLIAGEGSCQSAYGAKNGARCERLSRGYADRSPRESSRDKAGDQPHRRGAAGRRGQLVRNELDDREHSENSNGGGRSHKRERGSAKVQPVSMRSPSGDRRRRQGPHPRHHADSEGEKEDEGNVHVKRCIPDAGRCQEIWRGKKKTAETARWRNSAVRPLPAAARFFLVFAARILWHSAGSPEEDSSHAAVDTHRPYCGVAGVAGSRQRMDLVCSLPLIPF